MRTLFGIVIILGAVLAGAFYFLHDPDIPRSVLEARYGTPPSQYLTLDNGARVHVRDQGLKTGPVLILVHGSNAALFTWEPWVSRLGDTFRIVSLDMPGHGLTGAIPSGDYSLKSMSETVVQTADRLGLGKFAIAGNSMGGAVAARVAEDHPDRVSALILVDAGGMAQKMGQHIPIGFRIARTPLLNQLMLYITPRQVFDEGLRDSFAHQERVTAAMVTEYWELNRMDGTRQASLQRFRMPFDTYVRDHIAQIKAPTLILWGAKDNLIPVSAAHEYAARIEGARLIIFPDAGHVLQEDDPDQSAAAARSFLTSLPH